MIDRLSQHEAMRRDLSTKPHPLYGHSFPLMTLPSKTTADERKRLEVQAIPFALPKANVSALRIGDIAPHTPALDPQSLDFRAATGPQI